MSEQEQQKPVLTILARLESTTKPPLPTFHLFSSIPIAYNSFDEGVIAAVEYHRINVSKSVSMPEYRVYRHDGPDGVYGFVEIKSDRGEMTAFGLYKVMAGVFAPVLPS